MALQITDLKSGLTIELDNTVFMVLEAHHIKPGKGAAFVRTRIKNMSNNAVLERTFRASDNVQEAYVEQKNLIFQYSAGDNFHFMNKDTYDDVDIHKDNIEQAIPFLKDSIDVVALYYKGKIIQVNLPNFIECKVIETEPGVKGDTAKSTLKAAKIETGASIQVPLFINPGDFIKIDTRTGTYVERVMR